jgi:hypothetical protein
LFYSGIRLLLTTGEVPVPYITALYASLIFCYV